MKYTKPFLTYDKQAELLLSRGLEADKQALINRLQAVNYYRLSGYLYPFRQTDDTFTPGTTLDMVWKRYTFDRRLRTLVLDGIERIEVAFKTKAVYHHAEKTGPFGYTIPGNLPKMTGAQFGAFLSRVADETERSREQFMTHFKAAYGDQHPYPPLWMAVEIMSMGTMIKLYQGMDTPTKAEIAEPFSVMIKILQSWLLSLNVIRNICAHHGRLWNREIGFKPMIPTGRNHPDWRVPVRVEDNRIFGILTIIKYIHNIIAPQSKWPERLMELLHEYPDIPREPMGFPENWRDCPIWKSVNLRGKEPFKG